MRKKRGKKICAGIMALTLFVSGIPKQAEAESRQPQPGENESVRLIVELKEAPLLEQEAILQSAQEMDTENLLDSNIIAEEREALLSEHEMVREEIKHQWKGADDTKSFDYTVVFNGFSMEAKRKDIAEISRLPMVKSVREVSYFKTPETKKGENQAALALTDEMADSLALEEEQSHILGDSAVTGLSGKGVLISIIDTGIYEHHEIFSETSFLSPMEERKDKYQSVEDLQNVIGGQKLSSGVTNMSRTYVNRKLVYAYDYANQDYDAVCATDNHGAHVSGIAAGYARDAEGNTIFQGAAPDAQLMMMKVEEDGEDSMSDDAIMAALEDSLLLGADVVNMSLGDKSGFETSPTSEVLKKMEQAGIIVCVAAGNDGSSYDGIKPNGKPFAEDQDYGTISSLSADPSTLCVGSCQQGIYYQEGKLKVKNYHTEIPCYEISNQLWDRKSKEETFPKENIPYVFIPLDESGGVYEGRDVEGKIIVMNDEENLDYYDENFKAMLQGAVGMILIRRNEEWMEYELDDANIPVLVLTHSNGQKLLAAMQDGTGIIESVNITLEKQSIEKSGMSEFSSWGPTDALHMGISVSDVGSNVYSATYCYQDNDGVYQSDYGKMSGTSMATPRTAGACANLLEYLRENDETKQSLLEYQKRKNQASDEDSQLDEVVKSLLMNSAVPDQVEEYISPLTIQGGGRTDVQNILNTQTMIWTGDSELPEIDLGAKQLGDQASEIGFDLEFSVKNFSDTEKTYQLDGAVLSDQVQYTEYESQEIWGEGGAYGDGEIGVGALKKGKSAEEESYGDEVGIAFGYEVTGNSESLLGENKAALQYLSGDSFTLKAGEERDCRVHLSLSRELVEERMKIFTNGFFVYGYLFLTGPKGEKNTIPYLGYAGDWESANPMAEFRLSNEDELTLERSTMGYVTDTISNMEYRDYTDSEIIFHPDYLKNIAYLEGDPDYAEKEKISLSSSVFLKRNMEEIYYEVKKSDGTPVTSYASGPRRENKTDGDKENILTDWERCYDWETEESDFYASYEEKDKPWSSAKNESDLALNLLTGEKFRYSSLPEGEYLYAVTGKLEHGTKVFRNEIPFFVDLTHPVLTSAKGKKEEENYQLALKASDNRKLDDLYLYTENLDGTVLFQDRISFDEAIWDNGSYLFDVSNQIEQIKTMNDYEKTGIKEDVLYVTAADGAGLGSARKKVVFKEDATISQTSLKLYAGETAQITSNLSSNQCAENPIYWSSSKETVAEVDDTGKVYAKKAGTAVITLHYGSQKKKCKVTVTAQRMLLNTGTLFLETKGKGKKGTVYLTALQSREKAVSVKIIKGNKKIKISKKTIRGIGKKNAITVTAKKKGTAKIKFSNGTVFAVCKVKIKLPEVMVSFVADGKVIQTVRKGYGKTVKSIPAPQKQGYRFVGWYLKGKKYRFSTKIKKNIKLVAKFLPAGL